MAINAITQAGRRRPIGEHMAQMPATMPASNATIPIIMVSSIILNAFALFISSVIKQLENFATVMNFVIFPMFFLSSALYPLWKIKDSSLLLFNISSFNPFTKKSVRV